MDNPTRYQDLVNKINDLQVDRDRLERELKWTQNRLDALAEHVKNLMIGQGILQPDDDRPIVPT